MFRFGGEEVQRFGLEESRFRRLGLETIMQKSLDNTAGD